VNYGYNDAINRGIINGRHTFTFDGETVTIALQNGTVQSAWGSWRFTFEQLIALLG